MANWIAKAVGSGKGKLHANLGIPQNQNIPAKRLTSAENSSNPTIAREANLAKTLKGFHKIGK